MVTDPWVEVLEVARKVYIIKEIVPLGYKEPVREILNSQLIVWRIHATHSWGQIFWDVVVNEFFLQTVTEPVRSKTFGWFKNMPLKGLTVDNNPGGGDHKLCGERK